MLPRFAKRFNGFAVIESDRKGVPTLIKHYLKLNGRFLAFNLDWAFANVVDGLVWVDLIKTEWKMRHHFMGPQGPRPS